MLGPTAGIRLCTVRRLRATGTWRNYCSPTEPTSMPGPTTATRLCTVRPISSAKTWWNCCWPTTLRSIPRTTTARSRYAEYHNQGGQVSALLRQHGGRDSVGEIYDAVVQGDLGKVKALINENPELVRTEVHSGQTPLHWAASYGHKHISELLLGHKADANARARHGVRPLDNAASFGHKGVAVLLLA